LACRLEEVYIKGNPFRGPIPLGIELSKAIEEEVERAKSASNRLGSAQWLSVYIQNYVALRLFIWRVWYTGNSHERSFDFCMGVFTVGRKGIGNPITSKLWEVHHFTTHK
jgi:hypothetical protein